MPAQGLRIAVIGCGAIAERYAAVLPRTDAVLSLAIDRDGDAARDFAARHGFAGHATGYEDAFGKVDAAVVCLPNFLHAPASIALLGRGISVLCEKPMALTAPEGERMAEAAGSGGAVLAAAHVRRFFWSNARAREIAGRGELGRLLSITAEEGGPFSWPSRTGFLFDKAKSGGGILIDMGAHLLDLVLWWAGEFPHRVSCTDDDLGGVEADSEVSLAFPGGATAEIRVSRLRSLRNRTDLVFENGEVRIFPFDMERIVVRRRGGADETLHCPGHSDILDCFHRMVEDFLAAAGGGRKPAVSPADALPSIRLIDECYRVRRRFDHPWLSQGGGR